MTKVAGDAALTSISLPGDQFFPAKADEPMYARIGNSVQSYMAALPSLRAATDEFRTKVAERCIGAFDATGIIPASALASSGHRFVAWVNAKYPDAIWHTEVPVSGPRLKGGQWNGAIELLLYLPSGDVVVIDHKSAPIRRAACSGKAAEYVGQLAAYEGILESSGARVTGKWIHFPLAGVLAQCGE